MGTYKNSGFSVIEVLVVIVTIAVLGGVGFVGYKTLMKKDAAPAAQSAKTSSSKAKQDFSDVDTRSGFIDYQFRSGPVLSSAADTDLLKGAPAGFVAFLKADLDAQAGKYPNCKDDPYHIMVAKVDAKFAFGASGACGAGGKDIWGEIDGKWQRLTGGNGGGLSCADLYKYGVDTFIAGDTCTNYETNQTELYQPK